jgi:simple sugar transport system ATP-binding protein
MSTTETPASSPATRLLDIRELGLTFGSVTALRGVTMHANEGEVTAIIGDNGAGKSSLIKCVLGVNHPTSGTLSVRGEDVSVTSPRHARELGIEAVFQDLALADDLTVWQNMFLTRERKRGLSSLAPLAKRRMMDESAEMLRQLNVTIPSVRHTVRSMSGGQRQAIAIARAVAWGSGLVVMDEPTAALGLNERTEVEDVILRLRSEGRSFLVISHNFDQVLRISDAVWVMRQGRAIAHRRTSETSGDELVALITGAKAPEL